MRDVSSSLRSKTNLRISLGLRDSDHSERQLAWCHHPSRGSSGGQQQHEHREDHEGPVPSCRTTLALSPQKIAIILVVGLSLSHSSRQSCDQIISIISVRLG